MVAVDDRDSGRVVATIFEATKAIEQNWRCFSVSDVTDNSAHIWRWKLAFARRCRNLPVAGLAPCSAVVEQQKGCLNAWTLSYCWRGNPKRSASQTNVGRSGDVGSRSSTRHDTTNARHHYGWRRRHALIPIDERPR